MKMVFPAVSFLLLASTAPAGGQTSSPQRLAQARHAIDAGNAAYIAAFKHADAKALSQVYDPQGARLNDDGQVVRGRRAIADDVGKFVAKVGPVTVMLESKEVWLIEDTAYE